MNNQLDQFFATRAKAQPATVNTDNFGSIRILKTCNIDMPGEFIFRAMGYSKGIPDSEIDAALAENPELAQSAKSKWFIYRQMGGTGPVPCQVTRFSFVLSETKEKKTMALDLYGHDLAFKEVDTENGRVKVPVVDDEGNYIKIKSKGGQVIKEDGDDSLIGLAVRHRTQNGVTRLQIDAVNQNGMGAVIIKTNKTVAGKDGTFSVKQGFDLDNSSIPCVKYLALGLLNASEPIPEIGEMMELFDNEGNGSSKSLDEAMKDAMGLLKKGAKDLDDDSDEPEEDKVTTEEKGN